MQEDRFVEWLTVTTFLAAGVLRLSAAIRARRPFDFLVGLFCLFVAGEEMSWGQRLLGYTPPPAFLEHNSQQELTVHNFAAAFGKPKWTLVLTLLAYGVLLPVVAGVDRLQPMIRRIGATPPPTGYFAWYLAAAVLLVWYPLDYTGEWVELVAGMLFLLPVIPGATAAFILVPVVVSTSLALTSLSGKTADGAGLVSCARMEVNALLADLLGGAANAELLGAESYERRVRNAVTEGDISIAAVTRFPEVRCARSIDDSRRKYGIDPWGTSYWVTVKSGAEGRSEVAVYSFGPNRRRDEGKASDDVRASALTDPPWEAER